MVSWNQSATTRQTMSQLKRCSFKLQVSVCSLLSPPALRGKLCLLNPAPQLLVFTETLCLSCSGSELALKGQEEKELLAFCSFRQAEAALRVGSVRLISQGSLTPVNPVGKAEELSSNSWGFQCWILASAPAMPPRWPQVT